ncbi:FKBP-type peptidyl-prolyl cis-trans isomerase [Mariniflexile sp. HNIBRBA6329]|uniref:FKBP-type peptidyl-prolyl cis-trans isomerase n=1 Tax=Mariniflexile sp. HNIBRBA6329 TaxID=3373088 RepID=UPI00374661C5
MKNILLLAVALVLFTACNKDETVDYVAKNDEQIQAYIAANNLTAQKSSSGLYYVIDTPGTGAQPTATSNVTIAYKGYFLNGNVFDENTEGYTTNLKQVIKGWTEGMTYFKEGGSGMLLVPAHLGYGNADYYTIPGGSVLIFDVELLSVN